MIQCEKTKCTEHQNNDSIDDDFVIIVSNNNGHVGRKKFHFISHFVPILLLLTVYIVRIELNKMQRMSCEIVLEKKQKCCIHFMWWPRMLNLAPMLINKAEKVCLPCK